METLDRLWQQPTPPGGGKSSGGEAVGRAPRRLLIIGGSIILLFILANVAKSFFTDWLWFQDLGYQTVFTRTLGTKVLMFLLSAVAFAALFLGNVVLATRLSPGTEGRTLPWAVVSQLQRLSRWSVIGGTIFVSLIFGAVMVDGWIVTLKFFNAQPFGVTDPLFSKDISFYVFALPFWRMVHGWLLGVFIVSLLGVLGVYAISHTVQGGKPDIARPVLAHVGGLVIVILGLATWSYRLGIWDLVFSTQGVVSGAGYADIHARMPAQWILFGVVIVCVGLVVVAVVRRQVRWAAYGIGGWIVAAILVGAAFPAIVQRLRVQPDEFNLERPYIEYNIEFTREAFALDRVVDQSYPAKPMPTLADITANEVTINNIRLWDHRPLKETYNQIQAIRLYYDFNDVDVDRYTIDGEYRQVMLSARELSAENLASEAQTWVNRRLQFTHGYGIALSPVNEITPEGLPVLFVKDIPPVGIFDIVRPEIYYGEKANDYVIVGAVSDEFDYPAGDENIYGRYQGETGVSLGGFFRRLAYAWELADFNILISSQITEDSRLLLRRNIRERVSHLAPFLMLDNDPYLVVVDGRLLWVLDAYTVTDRYPYSEPLANGINYIRNSVKVVVDAYDGTAVFYISDPEDALIRTYQAIFPELFVDAAEMPDYLKAHRRYPEDMFNIQSSVYLSYHMRDARVFYNKEDLWAVAREDYAGSERQMEPYYVTMRLPGEDKAEFLLMLPFTPVSKNNTIGWLAARNDGDNYGKLLAYHFPKERLVYGPSQIENRIEQDTVITEQLALWGRGGSNVIRGNLLLIPLGESYIYVEPVFLEAQGGGLPELKRVIVAAGDVIAMEKTLDEAIAAVFGAAPPAAVVIPPAEPEEPVEPGTPVVVTGEAATLAAEAQRHFDLARQAARDGDWATFGEELDAVEALLAQLNALAVGE
ncbi:MAG: UPF0182 family protein [Dehalococcoidales bacterium]